MLPGSFFKTRPTIFILESGMPPHRILLILLPSIPMPWSQMQTAGTIAVFGPETIIQTKDCFAMFYTSRDQQDGDGFTQHIGLSISSNLKDWTHTNICIRAQHPFELFSIPGNTSIHAGAIPFYRLRTEHPRCY